MAKLYGKLTPLRGRLDTVVAYSWRGIQCLRAYRAEIHYPNTPLQREQKTRFVAMVRFASAALEALQAGLAREATRRKMTVGNVFVNNNSHRFTMENGAVEVDYSHLELSEGSVGGVVFHAADFAADEVVDVRFDKHAVLGRGSSEDMVYLFAYCPALQQGYTAQPVRRREKRVRTVLPQEWAGHEVHLYGFVVDREGRASATSYIGVGRVNHYEERGVYIPINKSWDEFVEIANRANGGAAAVVEEVAEVAEEVPTSPFADNRSAVDPPDIP